MSLYSCRLFWLLLGSFFGLIFMRSCVWQPRPVNLDIEIIEDTYCVIYNLTVAEDLNKRFTYEPITLAIHSTINLANNLIEQANTFDDLISYSVLIEFKTQTYLLTLLKLWDCVPNIRQKVSIHVVWERAIFQQKCIIDFIPRFDGICGDFEKWKAFPLMHPPVLIYPINYLRNIARRGAGSRLLIVADIENIFSVNFTHMVRNETQKLMHSQAKYVLICRRFEIENGVRRPWNVRELRILLKTGKAAFFHAHYFPNGHYIPDLSDWLHYSTNNDLVIARNEPYNNPAWEPQIIMKSDVPFHYTDVVTRRYDHQVLIRELCRAGYKFRTLSHVFNIHVGIKYNYTGMDILMKNVARYGGVRRNKLFQLYLDKNYPNTQSICPKL